MKNPDNHPVRSATKTLQVSQQIAALPELPMAELWKLWDQHFQSRPTHPNRKFLESRLAYRIQEAVFGGLPITTRSLLTEFGERLSKIRSGPRKANALLPGTVLLREYDGQEYRITVLADGRYEIDGRVFKSLSGIARMISGTNWSGASFFHLRKKTQS
jgi:hypothetical protein